jgi:hypothetical protein
MSDRDENILSFPEPISPEEKLRRITVEAKRLSEKPELEWQFWLKTTDIAEKLGTTRDYLKTAILGLIREREKKAAEDRRIEQRAERDKEKAKREEEVRRRRTPGARPKRKQRPSPTLPSCRAIGATMRLPN